jgi:hypothetical protein
MNAKSTFPQPSSLSTTVIAAVAAFIAVGVLISVAFLFQRDGAPMERLVTAEHACSQHAYISDRETCVREWLAVSQSFRVASKQ